MVKSFCKSVANFLAAILVMPSVVLCRASYGTVGPSRVFQGWSQLFSLVPGTMGEFVRRAFYRFTLAGCGQDISIGFGTVISHPSAAIGRSVYVGGFSILGDVTLEDDVIVASHVSIINGSAQHGIDRIDIPIRQQPGKWPRITIGMDSWIGERAVVQANIGRHCVIGAGSVVVKPIPDYAIAVGAPARVIRFRNQTDLADSISSDFTTDHGSEVSSNSKNVCEEIG
jgi:acetyltransferase-like isoleucine patch superfamily enzyme